jgi:hypothetical protein
MLGRGSEEGRADQRMGIKFKVACYVEDQETRMLERKTQKVWAWYHDYD